MRVYVINYTEDDNRHMIIQVGNSVQDVLNKFWAKHQGATDVKAKRL